MKHMLFYRPDNAVCADFIPFCEGGTFELFYLHDARDEAHFGIGTPWYKVRTENFIDFEEAGEMLPRGTREEQDLYVFTGSVLRAEGQYHIFYTGHNPFFREKGQPEQKVMHAVSDDLAHWKKLPEDTFGADPARYDIHNFRDPFVYWDGEADCYRMLLVQRRGEANYNAGFTAQYTSGDLKHWENAGAFWSPNLYNTHECPDLFRMGEYWYLIFSEYSDTRRTRYVVSRSPRGPWHIPANDTLDTRAFYAAKTAERDGKRYLFGWIATRQGDTDNGAWQWGGSLGVHRLVQEADGSLGCRMPETTEAAWEEAERAEDVALTTGPGAKEEMRLFSGVGDRWRVDMEMTFSQGTHAFGVSLAQDYASRHGYKYDFLPGEGRVRFGQVTYSLDSAEIDRCLPLEAGKPIRVTLLYEDGVCVLYANDRAVSSRAYAPRGEDIGLFAVDGAIRASHIRRYRFR